MLWLVVALAALEAEGVHDYCRRDRWHRGFGDNKLDFSKENCDNEYGLTGGFKTLHCCVTGYRSIEWFKDGVRYPWPTDISTLIVNPESWNQTIYTQAASQGDEGLYRCVASNDTHAIQHQVQLTISGSHHAAGPPRPTCIPRDQFAALGESTRLYCEAYIGNFNLPDAKGVVEWSRENCNQTLSDNNFKQKPTAREEEQIIGSYLFISGLSEEHFGKYICTVSNTADGRLTMAAMLARRDSTDEMDLLQCHNRTVFIVLISLFALFKIFVLAAIFTRWRLQLKHICKKLIDRHSPTEESVHDLVILYPEAESHTLHLVLLPLAVHYHCTTEAMSLSTDLWRRSLVVKSKMSRRLMVLVTPGLLHNEWSTTSLAKLLRGLLRIHPKIICIFFQELPVAPHKDTDGQCLIEVLQKVHYVMYSQYVSDPQRFWALVQLGLPGHDPSQHQGRFKRESRESLEGLV